MAQQDNYIGIAFGLDVTDLKAGLTETKKAIAQANAKFKSATAGMDDWQDSTEGLTEELEFLDTKLKNQKKNVKGYQAEIDNLTEKYGENSVQVQKLKKSLADEQQSLAKTEKAIREKTSRLNMLEGAYVDTITDVDQLQTSLKQLGGVLRDQKKIVSQYESQLERAKEEHGETSEEVKELTDKLNRAKTAVDKTEKAHDAYADQLAKVQSETKETKTDTDKLTGALKDADDATVSLKGGFTVLKGAMANLVSTGITSLVGGLQSAITESRELRSEMSFLQATATDTGASFDQAKDKVKEVYAVLGETDSAVEGLNNLMTAGFNGETLDKITDQLVGASIKWHDTLKFEGLADGLQETLATGKAIGPFVELLERGGMVAEDFDEGLAKCTSDAEKQNYVLQTLSKLGLAEITEGYRENNKTLIEGAEAQWDYEQSMAEVGEKAEPVLTTVKQGWVDVLNAVLDSSDGMSTADLQGKIKDAFAWFIDDALPKIKDGLKWIVDNMNILAPIVVTVGGLFAAWKVYGILKDVVGGVKNLITWMLTLKGTTLGTTASMLAQKVTMMATTAWTYAQAAAQWVLNTAFMGFPLVWILAAIAAVVAAVILLWKNWDKVTEWLGKAWEWLKDVAEKVWKAIKDFFIGAWESIKKVWSTVKDFFKGIWDGIKKIFSVVGSFFKQRFEQGKKNIQNAWSTVTGFFSDIWTGIKKVFSAVGSWFKERFQNAVTNIRNAWSTVKGFFSNIWSGIKGVFSKVASTLGGYFRTAWSNIKSAWSGVTKWFSGLVDKIVGFFKGIPKKMIQIGKDMMDGLKNGLTSGVRKVKDAAKGAVDGIVGKFKSLLGIHSPSTVMADEVGEPITQGIAEGILKGIYHVEDATEKAINEVRDKLQTVWAKDQLEIGIGELDMNYELSEEEYTDKLNELLSKVVELEQQGLTEGWLTIQEEVAAGAEETVDLMYGYGEDIGSSIGDGISYGMDGTVENMEYYGYDVGVGFGSGVTSSTEQVSQDLDTFKSSVDAKLSTYGGDWKAKLHEMGANMVGGLVEGLRSMFAELDATISDLNDKIAQVNNLTASLNGAKDSLQTAQGTVQSVTNVTNYNQTINAPKSPSRIEIYRDTKNLLATKG